MRRLVFDEVVFSGGAGSAVRQEPQLLRSPPWRLLQGRMPAHIPGLALTSEVALPKNLARFWNLDS